MRQFEQWSDDGGHTETVAILEDVIATLEGVQTQHQVLIDRIYEATVKAAEVEEKWPDSGFPWALINEIQQLIEEDA